MSKIKKDTFEEIKKIFTAEFEIKEHVYPLPFESKGKKIKFVNEYNNFCSITSYEGKDKNSVYLIFVVNNKKKELKLSNEAVKALMCLLSQREKNG